MSKQKEPDSISKADVVIVDGSENIRNDLSLLLKEKRKIVDTYSCPKDLLKNLTKYSKDTQISFGYVFNKDISGLKLAKRLLNAGYVNLCMLTWMEFKLINIPCYVRYLPKSDDRRHDVDRLLSKWKIIKSTLARLQIQLNRFLRKTV